MSGGPDDPKGPGPVGPEAPAAESLDAESLDAESLDDTRTSADATHVAARPPTIGTAVPVAGLRRGGEVGRFLLLEPLGAGGMGEVWLAYDPRLDRRLALKFIRADLDLGGSEGPLRLEREAQVMARLRHPNVVQVFDVGEHAGAPYVAMEFVPGGTLGAWGRKPGHDWRARVRAYVKAGRGLEAAHAAGLIHRDFKPENVLLELDGTPKVGDFGLARTTAPTPGGDVTATVAGVGTPAYMSPEQFQGRSATARSDQFSFAAALWEQLFGERPFAGEAYAEIEREVLAGRVRVPSDGRGVPPAVRSALQRALSTDPAQRFPEMGALLDTLDRRVRFSPVRLAVQGAALVAVVGTLGGLGLSAWREEGRCARETAAKRPVLEGARLGRIAKAMEVSGRGSEGMREVQGWLTSQLDEWASERTAACNATRSDPAAARRLACLDDAADSYDQLIELAGGVTAEEGSRLIGMLEDTEAPVHTCNLPRPVVAAPDPVELRLRLGRLAGLYSFGRYEEALSFANALVDDARAAEARSTLGHALNLRALIRHSLTQDWQASVADAREAVLTHDALGSDPDRLRGLDTLATVLSSHGRTEEAAEAVREMESVNARLGRPPFWTAMVEANSGMVSAWRGDARAVVVHARRSVELARTLLRPRSAQFARFLNDLGNALSEVEPADPEAFAAWREAISIADANEGPGSTDAFVMRMNVAENLGLLGRIDEAIATQDEAAVALGSRYQPAAATRWWWAVARAGLLARHRPGSPELPRRLAEADALSTQIDEADRDPEIAAEWRIARARLALAQGQLRQAGEELEQAQVAAEGSELSPPMHRRIQLVQAEVALAGGRPGEARALVEETERAGPRRPSEQRDIDALRSRLGAADAGR